MTTVTKKIKKHKLKIQLIKDRLSTPINYFRKTFEPYFYTKPQELTNLEKWVDENPVFKDYVYQLPENYQKPSLYHPAYLGKKGNTEVDIPEDKIGLNDTGAGLSYHAEGDEPKIPVKDINPLHKDEFDILTNISDFISNKSKLPANSIVFAQNHNTMEALMFTGGGRHDFYSRQYDKKQQKIDRIRRSDAKKDSRIKVIDKMINTKTGKTSDGRKYTYEDWQWTHFFPVGYHGSEGDRRLGLRWWGEDNQGVMANFENRQKKHEEGFYWLVRIERVDGETVVEEQSATLFGEAGKSLSAKTQSGIRWIAKTYSQKGDLLDEMTVEHLIPYMTESTNVWNPDYADSWIWSFGIDEVIEATVSEEEEANEVDDNDIYSDYNYSTERFVFKSKEPSTVVSFGNDSNGNPVKVDLATPEACHVIFCGTTGSGKSVEVVSIISQLMAHNTPQQVQFVGIDPKMTEFAVYKDSPYFAVNPILDTNEASMLSRFALMVSETRSAQFAQIGVKNLDEYNKWIDENKAKAEKLKFGYLPHLFLLTDEFASLMAQNRQENEDTFNRIAAECRAQGVHALLATQRPSVDVITGTMKNNFPAKCGLSMGSSVDSSTLMEVEENDINPHQLKGRGDNILKTQNRRVRSQGYFFSNDDVQHINLFNKVNYYGVVREGDKLVPDLSKARMINYKRELVRAGLAEKIDGVYTLVKKKKAI